MSVDHIAPSRLAGRYVLRQLIAAGGMGEVHLATDERLGREVAVKVLAHALTDSPESVERFRREALAAAGLSHPNIARVYDYGVEGDRHFIVMEYIDGQSLGRLLREHGPLSPGEAVRIASEVCDALAAAHRAGIVHRDVKPGNVMVARDGTVKVTDFGISKALGSSPLTDTGTILGTAAYLPPEVARGGSAGPASDVYSLGIVLYEMLTGQVPFSGETPVVVAMRHLSEDVPAPSTLVPDLPHFLDDAVARATRISPEERYPSAEAMAEALRLRKTQPIPVAADDLATQAMTTPMAAAGPATQALPSTALLHDREHASNDRDHTPDHRAKAGPKRRRWVIAAVATALLVALGAVGTSLLGGNDQSPSTAGRPSNTPSTSTSSAPSPTSTATTNGNARAGVVPDGLVGSDLDSAVAAVKKAGLSYQWRMVASDAPRNQVIDATPSAGTTVKAGDPVMLIVSRGPDSSASNADTNNGDGNNGNGNNGKGNGKGKDKRH